MSSDYVVKAIDANPINHGDATVGLPLANAGRGGDGSAPDSMNDRLSFTAPPGLGNDQTWTGENTYSGDTIFTGTSQFDSIEYTDTYYEDLKVSVEQVRIQGASNIPAWGALSSTYPNAYVLWFDPTTMEQVFFAVQLPHKWKEGTSIHPHVHCVPSESAAGDAGTFRWGLQYTMADVGGTFEGGTVYGSTFVPDDAQPYAETHYVVPLTSIGMSIRKLSCMLLCRLFRDATHADDDLPYDAGLMGIDFHYEIDKPGSTNEYDND